MVTEVLCVNMVAQNEPGRIPKQAEAKITQSTKGEPFYYENIGAVISGCRPYSRVEDVSHKPNVSSSEPVYSVEWGVDRADGAQFDPILRTPLSAYLADELDIDPAVMKKPAQLTALATRLAEIDVRFFRLGVDSLGQGQVLRALSDTNNVTESALVVEENNLLKQYKTEYQNTLAIYQSPVSQGKE